MKESVELLKPLTWLNGKWKGKGKASFPTHANFEYDDYFQFKYLKDSFNLEPIIHFEEKAYVYESGQRVFKHWETGFLKPTSDGRIQLYVCHNTGRIEVCYGEFKTIDHQQRSFEIDFNSEFVRNDEGIKTMTSSLREISFKDGELRYLLKMSTAEVEKLTSHLTSESKLV